MGRVVEIDVRLRGAVDQQRPAARALGVGYELREPAVDGLDDGGGRRPITLSVPGHEPIIGARADAPPDEPTG
ncbi:hypothetical protein GCM10010272_40670 [Streptomyces lateritius]|nr:hypothetical protein GCM10010272_40670 [Streptomyces lateritius]